MMNRLFSILLPVTVVILCSIYIIRMPSFTRSLTGSIDQTVDKNQLESHVKLLSENFVPRSCDYPVILNSAAQYIQQQFNQTNTHTALQNYTIGKDTFSNVISNYGPDSDAIIVVGAHYDAYASYPGADDNASGVAGLLELGRLLSNAELNTRIVLVAYACEEPPWYGGSSMGSVIHANSITDKDVQLMISLEMIGYFTKANNSQSFPIPALKYLYPDQGNFIAVVGELLSPHARDLKNSINHHTDLNAYSINAPKSLTGIDFSDHRNYWALGYPAVMVTDTAFYRNRNYHHATDTPDTLNYSEMAKVVYDVHQYITGLANKN